MKRNLIIFVMTVTGGNREVTVSVDEDKRPGGLERMKIQAFKKAQKFFQKGITLRIKSNWNKYDEK